MHHRCSLSRQPTRRRDEGGPGTASASQRAREVDPPSLLSGIPPPPRRAAPQRAGLTLACGSMTGGALVSRSAAGPPPGSDGSASGVVPPFQAGPLLRSLHLVRGQLCLGHGGQLMPGLGLDVHNAAAGEGVPARAALLDTGQEAQTGVGLGDVARGQPRRCGSCKGPAGRGATSQSPRSARFHHAWRLRGRSWPPRCAHIRSRGAQHPLPGWELEPDAGGAAHLENAQGGPGRGKLFLLAP